MVRDVVRNAGGLTHHAIAAALLDLDLATRDLTGAAARTLGVLVEAGLEADRHGIWFLMPVAGASVRCRIWVNLACIQGDKTTTTTTTTKQQQQHR